MISTTNAGIWSISSLRGSDAPVIEARILLSPALEQGLALVFEQREKRRGGPLSITIEM